jgi:hypothetical protein
MLFYLFIENDGKSNLFCRIRRYRGLRGGNGVSCGYGVREREICFVPFRLAFSFREVSHIENSGMYLVITAQPVLSPYEGNYCILYNNVYFILNNIYRKQIYAKSVRHKTQLERYDQSCKCRSCGLFRIFTSRYNRKVHLRLVSSRRHDAFKGHIRNCD